MASIFIAQAIVEKNNNNEYNYTNISPLAKKDGIFTENVIRELNNESFIQIGSLEDVQNINYELIYISIQGVPGTKIRINGFVNSFIIGQNGIFEIYKYYDNPIENVQILLPNVVPLQREKEFDTNNQKYIIDVVYRKKGVS